MNPIFFIYGCKGTKNVPYMQNNCKKICVCQKKAVLLHAFSKNEFSGVPENFNFWGEREHGENSYERRSRESY